MSRARAAIVLAAGKGKRMKSDLPKVLHPLLGRPLIATLLDTLAPMKFDPMVIVIGHGGELVKNELRSYPARFVWQHDQRGTGHAVMMARQTLQSFDGTTLVLAGDVPLLRAETIQRLITLHERTAASATCLSACFPDPTGYGRVIRVGATDQLAQIVEHKDASPSELQVGECNSGTFCFDNRALFDCIDQLSDNNAQGEYYLTDVVKIMHDKGLRTSVLLAEDPVEVTGINSADDLRELERMLALRTQA